jgi:site-specific recombinase XerD
MDIVISYVITFVNTICKNKLGIMTNIQLADIDMGTRTIKVMGKGAKERRVPFSNETQKAIVRYLQTRQRKGYDSPALWVSEEGTPITLSGMASIMIKLIRRCGIKVGGPHRFRHTGAIMFLRNGGSEFSLQILLGHATLEMTRKYVRTLGIDDVIRAHLTASPVENLFKKA